MIIEYVKVYYFAFLVLPDILKSISSGQILNNDESNSTDTSLMTQAVMKLLIDARKLQLSEGHFANQVTMQTGLSDEIIEVLWKFLMSSDPCLDELITSNEYKFRDLEWRLEAKVE